MQRKITTIELLDAPNEYFVKVHGLGERRKEEVLKIIEESIKKNQVKKATKVTHKHNHKKESGYEEHQYTPYVTYQFHVSDRGDKETIRVIAPNGIDKVDEARLDAMCQEMIVVKEKNQTKKLVKVLATATLVMISLPLAKITFEKMEKDSIVEAFNDYKTMQENIVRENNRRANTNMPRINTFGEELPTDMDDLNALSSVYKENLEEYQISPELNAIMKKYYSNQPLTVEEMKLFLEDFYNRKDIYLESVKEFNELEEKGLNR